MLVGKAFHASDHVALQLFYVLESLGLHASLTVGTGFPALLSGFVSANVDIFAGEHVKDFQKDILQERVCAFLSGAQLALAWSAIGKAACQFGIGGTGLIVVPGHFNLGNHLNVSFFGKRQNLCNVLFGIVAAIGIGRSLLHKVSANLVHLPIPEIGHRTPCRKLCEARVGVNLHAPSRIVHQMEVEAVQLEQGHHLQLLQQEFLSLIVAALVQHYSTVLEPWPVQNGAAGYGTVQGSHHLERLLCIEHTFLMGSLNLHLALANLHPIGRLELPVGQLLSVQTVKESLFRYFHLLGQACQLVGTNASGAYG